MAWDSTKVDWSPSDSTNGRLNAVDWNSIVSYVKGIYSDIATHIATYHIANDDARLSNARTPTEHQHPETDITGLDTSLSGKSDTSHTHTDTYEAKNANIQSHISSAHLALGETEETAYQGYKGQIAYHHALEAHAAVDAISATQKGAASGVVPLNSSSKIDSTYLPAYVDDVIEAATAAGFPETGTAGIIYVALDTNKTFRWSGSAYVEISASLALGETSSTAYAGDKGKTAYDHSQTAHAPVGAEQNVQPDWNQATDTSDDYIKNKPTLGTAAAKNIPATGDASATEIVYGSDTRLTNARTPTTHAHAESDVTGLSTSLSGKSDSSHNHDSAYLGATAKAADSDKLDGNDSSAFAVSNHNHTDTYEAKNANIQSHISSAHLALGETSSTAYAGDKGKTAYDHSQAAHAPADANNYVHPAAHAPAIITQDASNRFVTDAEKSTWNGKQAPATTLAGYGITDAEPAISKQTAFNKNYGTTATDVKVNGTQAIGTIDAISRIDHVHPTDTSRAATTQKLDDFSTPDDNTDLNANTTNHGLLLKAIAPAANVLNVVSIATGETAYTNKPLFDATNPGMDGAASPGTSLIAAHRDHIHPVDTSRAPLASPTLTGTPAAPTAATGTNTTQIATTAFVNIVVSNAWFLGAGSVIGVQWDTSNSSPTLTRIDSDGNEINSAIFDQMRFFNNYQIHGLMQRCSLTDAGVATFGTDAKGTGLTLTNDYIMVRIPRVYVRCEISGVYVRWWVSPVEYPGFVLHPAFYQRGHSVSQPNQLYVGAYTAGANGGTTTANAATNTIMATSLTGLKLTSKAGVKCLTNHTVTQFETAGNLIGTGWGVMNFWTHSLLELLFFVEYGSLNSQLKLGQGRTHGSNTAAAITGTNLAQVGEGAGVDIQSLLAANGTYGVQTTYELVVWRGIENLWGNIYQFCPGYNPTDTEHHVLNRDGTGTISGDLAVGSYETVTSPAPLNGTTNISGTDNGAYCSGYVSSLAFDSSGILNLALIPTTLTGSSSQYLPDYYYSHQSGLGRNGILLVGGGWYDGGDAGVGSRAALYGLTDVDSLVGGRAEFVG